MIQGPLGGDRESESSEVSGPTAAAAFSVQESSKAAKGTETCQRQGAKSKLSVIPGILGNKKPGIFSPVFNGMKKKLNKQGLSTK